MFRKTLRRDQVLTFFSTLPRCLVAMEACASAHHWAREVAALGHDTRLVPPAHVKPFVKRQKNDMADAEAICEAAQRPTMRFVQGKKAEAQASAVVFRTRDLLVRQRRQLVDALRGHLTTFGYIMAQRSEDGLGKTTEMIKRFKRAISGWTRPAISMQASSRDDGCINEPDTRKHLNLRSQNLSIDPLNPTGRPHTVVQACQGDPESCHPFSWAPNVCNWVESGGTAFGSRMS